MTLNDTQRQFSARIWAFWAYGAALKRRFRPGGVIRLVDVGGNAKLVGVCRQV